MSVSSPRLQIEDFDEKGLYLLGIDVEVNAHVLFVKNVKLRHLHNFFHLG